MRQVCAANSDKYITFLLRTKDSTSYQTLPVSHDCPLKPAAHLQVFVKSPLSTQIPPFKQGLGRHMLGTVQTYHHYLSIMTYFDHALLAHPMVTVNKICATILMVFYT